MRKRLNCEPPGVGCYDFKTRSETLDTLGWLGQRGITMSTTENSSFYPSLEANLSRRAFVRTVSGLAVSAGVLPGAGSVFGATRKKWAVSCRDGHLKVVGKPDAWSSLKALGVDNVEVVASMDLSCPNLFHPDRKYTLATKEGIKTLRDDLHANGCRITAFVMSNRFDEQLEAELECARGLVKAADKLGVRAIRIDVVPRKLKPDEFLPFAIQACKRLCETAKGTSVCFGVENHGRTTNDPAFLERLFDGVGSKHLGLTLDTGNFYWWGHPQQDLYAIYEKFAPRTVHTHCKSIRYPDDKKNVRSEIGWEYGKYCCPIYDGDIDYPRLIGILRRAKYQGDLCLEDESLDKFAAAERAGVVRKELAMLQELAG